MITKELFQDLPLDKKGDVLFSNGDYIAVRSCDNHKVQLYSLYGFYVEVWYNAATNSIDKIEVLESEKTLSLFLSDIDLETLLNN